MMTPLLRTLMATSVALLYSAASITSAQAHRTYSGIEVDVVTDVRIEAGHFDEYMTYVATTWKRDVEALLKAGVICRWEVLTLVPAGPNDPNLKLIVAYTNWAGFDGAEEKTNTVIKQLYGSVAAYDAAAAERSKIGHVLGASSMQILEWK